MYDVIWYPSTRCYVVQHINVRTEALKHTWFSYWAAREYWPTDYRYTPFCNCPCLMDTFRGYSEATKAINDYPTRGAYV